MGLGAETPGIPSMSSATSLASAASALVCRFFESPLLLSPLALPAAPPLAPALAAATPALTGALLVAALAALAGADADASAEGLLSEVAGTFAFAGAAAAGFTGSFRSPTAALATLCACALRSASDADFAAFTAAPS